MLELRPRHEASETRDSGKAEERERLSSLESGCGAVQVCAAGDNRRFSPTHSHLSLRPKSARKRGGSGGTNMYVSTALGLDVRLPRQPFAMWLSVQCMSSRERRRAEDTRFRCGGPCQVE
jgi:hypothetical protein